MITHLAYITEYMLRIVYILLFALVTTACSIDNLEPQILGNTMGTTYSVQWHPQDVSASQLKQKIDNRLQAINALMSTYDASSELSQFNQSRDTGWHAVDPTLAALVDLSAHIHQNSQGAFDITVGPLVNLWGFGPDQAEFSFPDDGEIQIAQRSVGAQHLMVRSDPPALYKNIPDLYVDLSAIAKGYGVDAVANIMEQAGVENYMVEIGGEVKCKGVGYHGDAWRIGIEAPNFERGKIEEILALDNIAVATSGDYRNFIEHQGQYYSHTIDPTTGYPVTHNLGSITVAHQSAAQADAWATALLVLGPERALEIANQQQLPVLMITREARGYKSTSNQYMRRYLHTP